MELVLHARNLDLNQHMRQYISRKVNRVSRHLPEITLARVELVRQSTRSQKDQVSAQITLDVKGTILRAEERGRNVQAAFDAVVDVVDRRAQRLKAQIYRSEQAKRGSRARPRRVPQGGPSGEEEPESREVLTSLGKVVRMKRFPMKPTTVEEAALEMELLGHTFFLFLNGETGSYNVLYRREDGDYGLIQPEPL